MLLRNTWRVENTGAIWSSKLKAIDEWRGEVKWE